MTKDEARIPNVEDSRLRDERSAADAQRAASLELPQVGQFSLQALFYVSLFAAIACAIVMPIVRSWPVEFQWRFALTLGIYFGIVGLTAILFIRSQRVARRNSGSLLLFVPHGSPRGERGYFFTFTVITWLVWFLQMHLMATGSQPKTINFISLYVVFHAVNVTIFIFAGMRGVQFREHAIVSGKTRVEWTDISRFSWGPHSTLVVFIKSGRAVVPLGGIPPDQRPGVEAILEDQLSRAQSAETVAV